MIRRIEDRESGDRSNEKRMGRDAFAAAVLAKIRALAPTQEFVYREEKFTIEDSGQKGAVLNLESIYKKYRAQSTLLPDQVIERAATFLASGHSILDSMFEYSSAINNILPIVAPRIEMCIPDWKPPYGSAMPLSDHLSVSFCVDSEAHIVYVPDHLLESWGLNYEKAREIAVTNLRRLHPNPFVRLDAGLYASAWGDMYDGSRVLLTDEIGELSLQGRPVAMVSTRCQLLIFGEYDYKAAGRVLDITKSDRAEYDYVSGTPIIFQEGHWRTFVPPKDHPFKIAYDNRRLKDEQCSYGLQVDEYQHRVDHAFSSYMIGSRKDGHKCSVSIWNTSLNQLMPHTERITIISMEKSGKLYIDAFFIPWDDACAILRDIVKETKHYPHRTLFSGPPSRSQLAALRELEGMDGWIPPESGEERYF